METKKISFFSKDPIACPVCKNSFHKEEMLTGRGRLSAKDLTKEMRRMYDPIPGLGPITPLMYSISTCPDCFTSLFNADWGQVKFTPNEIQELLANKDKRKNMLLSVFKKELDFNKHKNQTMATASYYLALASYPYVAAKYSPSIKCAISALRLSWLLEDLASMQPTNTTYWDAVRLKLQPKTFEYLDIAYKKVLKQEESLQFFGPDTDRNNGFEGLVYIHHYYQFKTVPKDNPILVEQTAKDIKRDLSRIFGIGKPSKERPVAILDMVRDLYTEMKIELEKLSIFDDE